MREDIISFAPDGDNIPFFVSTCGISYCDGSYRIERKDSDTNVIEFILSGTGTVKENDFEFSASEGDIYYLKQGNNQLYYSDSENPWIKIWMNFRGELAEKITGCYKLDTRVHFHVPELEDKFRRIIEIAEKGESAKQVSEKLALVFLEIVQRLAYENNAEYEKKSLIAEKSKRYIDNIRNYDVTLDEIADKVYCSKCHLIREFKSEYGVTPYEYILEKRFAVAAEMLKNTALSVTEIAERTGFCDVRYFSACFSGRFGMSPTAYRKNKKIGLQKNIKHDII